MSVPQCITFQLDVSLIPRIPSNFYISIKEVVMEMASVGKASQNNGLSTSNYSMGTPAKPDCVLSILEKYCFLLQKLSWRCSCGNFSPSTGLATCCRFGLTCSSTPDAGSACKSRPFFPQLTWSLAFFIVMYLNCCVNLWRVASSLSE